MHTTFTQASQFEARKRRSGLAVHLALEASGRRSTTASALVGDGGLGSWHSAGLDGHVGRVFGLGAHFAGHNVGVEARFVGVVRDGPRGSVGVRQGILAGDFAAAVSVLLVRVAAVLKLGEVLEGVRDRRAVVLLGCTPPLSGLQAMNHREWVESVTDKMRPTWRLFETLGLQHALDAFRRALAAGARSRLTKYRSAIEGGKLAREADRLKFFPDLLIILVTIS